ncbi:MAG: tyrosine-type recombinase/integrase [Candidatus Falkowbacteria bacterium]
MSQNKELYDQFLDWLRIGHSPETVQSYRWGLKIFIDWCDGTEKEILEMKEMDFVEYGLYLVDDRKLKKSTQSSYLCGVRGLWRWLHRQGKVETNDDIIPVPKDNDKEHYPFVLPQEVKLMSSYFDEFFPDQLRDKTIISFLNATGLRIGEMLAIDVSQINLEEKKAVVRTFKRRNHKREVYWDNDTNDLLAKWIDARERLSIKATYKSNALFINLSTTNPGKRLYKGSVQRMIRRVRKEVGIERCITAHSFRHGFGKKAVEHNVHPRYLQKMLGHAKLNTTMFYMGVADGELEKVYRSQMEQSITQS